MSTMNYLIDIDAELKNLFSMRMPQRPTSDGPTSDFSNNCCIIFYISSVAIIFVYIILKAIFKILQDDIPTLGHFVWPKKTLDFFRRTTKNIWSEKIKHYLHSFNPTFYKEKSIRECTSSLALNTTCIRDNTLKIPELNHSETNSQQTCISCSNTEKKKTSLKAIDKMTDPYPLVSKKPCVHVKKESPLTKCQTLVKDDNEPFESQPSNAKIINKSESKNKGRMNNRIRSSWTLCCEQYKSDKALHTDLTGKHDHLVDSSDKKCLPVATLTTAKRVATHESVHEQACLRNVNMCGMSMHSTQEDNTAYSCTTFWSEFRENIVLSRTSPAITDGTESTGTNKYNKSTESYFLPEANKSDSMNMAELDTTNMAELDTTYMAELDTTYMAELDTTYMAELDTTYMAELDTTNTAESDTTDMAESDTTNMAESDSTNMAESNATILTESDIIATEDSDQEIFTDDPELLKKLKNMKKIYKENSLDCLHYEEAKFRLLKFFTSQMPEKHVSPLWCKRQNESWEMNDFVRHEQVRMVESLLSLEEPRHSGVEKKIHSHMEKEYGFDCSPHDVIACRDNELLKERSHQEFAIRYFDGDPNKATPAGVHRWLEQCTFRHSDILTLSSTPVSSSRRQNGDNESRTDPDTVSVEILADRMTLNEACRSKCNEILSELSKESVPYNFVTLSSFLKAKEIQQEKETRRISEINITEAGLVQNLTEKYLAHHMKPLGEHVNPLADHVKTFADHVEPLTDHLKHLSDHVKPSSNSMISLADHVKHSNDKVKPLSDHLQPLADIVKPLNEHVKPLDNTITPLDYYVKPLADHVKPSADNVTPSADHVKPLADYVKPSADNVTPSADHVKPLADYVKPSADNVTPSADHVKPSADHVKSNITKLAAKAKRKFYPKSVASVKRQANTKEKSKISSLVRPMALLELLLGSEKQAPNKQSQENDQNHTLNERAKASPIQQQSDKIQRMKETKLNSKSSIRNKFSVKNWKPGVLMNMKRELDNKCRLKSKKTTEVIPTMVSCMNEVCGPSDSLNSVENGSEPKTNKLMSVSVNFVALRPSELSVFKDTANCKELKIDLTPHLINSSQILNTISKSPVTDLISAQEPNKTFKSPQQRSRKSKSPHKMSLNAKSSLGTNTTTKSKQQSCTNSKSIEKIEVFLISPTKLNFESHEKITMNARSPNRINTISTSSHRVNVVSNFAHKIKTTSTSPQRINTISTSPHRANAFSNSAHKINTISTSPKRINTISTSPHKANPISNFAPRNITISTSPHRANTSSPSPLKAHTIPESQHILSMHSRPLQERKNITKSQIKAPQGIYNTIEKSSSRMDTPSLEMVSIYVSQHSAHPTAHSSHGIAYVSPNLLDIIEKSPHGNNTIYDSPHGLNTIPTPKSIQRMGNSQQYMQAVKKIQRPHHGIITSLEIIPQTTCIMENILKSSQTVEYSKHKTENISEALVTLDRAIEAKCKSSPNCAVEISPMSTCKFKTMPETMHGDMLKLTNVCIPECANNLDKFSDCNGKQSGLKYTTAKSTQKTNIPKAKKCKHTDKCYSPSDQSKLEDTSCKKQAFEMLFSKKISPCEPNKEKGKTFTQKKKVFTSRIPKANQTFLNESKEDDKMKGIKRKLISKKISFIAPSESREIITDTNSYNKDRKTKSIINKSLLKIDTTKFVDVSEDDRSSKYSSNLSKTLLKSTSEVSKKLPKSSSVITKKFYMPRTQKPGESTLIVTGKQDTSLETVKLVRLLPLSMQQSKQQKMIMKTKSFIYLEPDSKKNISQVKQNPLENNVKNNLRRTPFQQKLQFLLKNSKYVSKTNLQAKNVAALIKRSSDVINNTKNTLNTTKIENAHKYMSDNKDIVAGMGKRAKKMSKFCKGHRKKLLGGISSCHESIESLSVASKIPNILIPTISLLYKKNSLKYKSKSLNTNLVSALPNEETTTVNDLHEYDKLTKFYSDHQVIKAIRSKSMNYLKYNKAPDICTLNPLSAIELKGMSQFDLLPTLHHSEGLLDNDIKINGEPKKLWLNKSSVFKSSDGNKVSCAKMFTESESLCSGSTKHANIDHKENEYKQVNYTQAVGVSSEHTSESQVVQTMNPSASHMAVANYSLKSFLHQENFLTDQEEKKNALGRPKTSLISLYHKHTPVQNPTLSLSFPVSTNYVSKLSCGDTASDTNLAQVNNVTLSVSENSIWHDESKKYLFPFSTKKPKQDEISFMAAHLIVGPCVKTSDSSSASVLSQHYELCKPTFGFKSIHAQAAYKAKPDSIVQRQKHGDLGLNFDGPVIDPVPKGMHKCKKNRKSPQKIVNTLASNDFNKNLKMSTKRIIISKLDDKNTKLHDQSFTFNKLLKEKSSYKCHILPETGKSIFTSPCSPISAATCLSDTKVKSHLDFEKKDVDLAAKPQSLCGFQIVTKNHNQKIRQDEESEITRGEKDTGDNILLKSALEKSNKGTSEYNSVTYLDAGGLVRESNLDAGLHEDSGDLVRESNLDAGLHEDSGDLVRETNLDAGLHEDCGNLVRETNLDAGLHEDCGDLVRESSLDAGLHEDSGGLVREINLDAGLHEYSGDLVRETNLDAGLHEDSGGLVRETNLDAGLHEDNGNLVRETNLDAGLASLDEKEITTISNATGLEAISLHFGDDVTLKSCSNSEVTRRSFCLMGWNSTETQAIEHKRKKTMMDANPLIELKRRRLSVLDCRKKKKFKDCVRLLNKRLIRKCEMKSLCVYSHQSNSPTTSQAQLTEHLNNMLDTLELKEGEQQAIGKSQESCKAKRNAGSSDTCCAVQWSEDLESLLNLELTGLDEGQGPDTKHLFSKHNRGVKVGRCRRRSSLNMGRVSFTVSRENSLQLSENMDTEAKKAFHYIYLPNPDGNKSKRLNEFLLSKRQCEVNPVYVGQISRSKGSTVTNRAQSSEEEERLLAVLEQPLKIRSSRSRVKSLELPDCPAPVKADCALSGREEMKQANRPQDSLKQTHRAQDSLTQTNRAQNCLTETNRSQDSLTQTNRAHNCLTQTNRAQDCLTQTNRAHNCLTQTNRAQDCLTQTNRAQDCLTQTNRAQDSLIQTNRSQDCLTKTNRSQDSLTQTNRRSQDSLTQTNRSQKQNSSRDICSKEKICSEHLITYNSDLEEIDIPSEHYIHCVVPQDTQSKLNKNMFKEHLSIEPTQKSNDCVKKRDDDSNESILQLSSNLSKSSLRPGLESQVNSFSNQSKNQEVHISDMFLTQSTIDRIHDENDCLTLDNKSSSSSSIVLSWIGSDISEVDNVLESNTHGLKCSMTEPVTKNFHYHDVNRVAGKAVNIPYECFHANLHPRPISPFKLDPIQKLNSSLEIYCGHGRDYEEQSYQVKQNTSCVMVSDNKNLVMVSDNKNLVMHSNYSALNKTPKRKVLIDQAAVFHNNQCQSASAFPFPYESGQDFTSCSETMSGSHSLAEAENNLHYTSNMIKKTKQENTGLQINTSKSDYRKRNKLKMKGGQSNTKQHTLTPLKPHTLTPTEPNPSSSITSKSMASEIKLCVRHKKNLPSKEHLSTSFNRFMGQQSKLKSKIQHSSKTTANKPARENATSEWYKPQYVPLSPSLSENHSWPLNIKPGSSKTKKPNVQEASSEPVNCTANQMLCSATNSDVDTCDVLPADAHAHNKPTGHQDEPLSQNTPPTPHKVKNIIQMFEKKKKT